MYRTSSRLMTALIAVCASPALVATAEAQSDAPAMTHTHMTFTSDRPGTAADTGRALAVVQALKEAVSPYQTLDQAQAAGYRARRDPATVMEGKLLHVGKRPKAAGEQADFDPKAPQALLYRRGSDGQMHLAGAMFVAPLSATTDDLDAMIPLSVAHWHQHTNVCVSADRKSHGRLRNASTAEACAAQGGRFRTQSRYMVHVMIDGGDDLALAFPQGRDEMEGMDMGQGHRD